MPISQDGILYENEAQLLLNQPVEAPTKVTVRPSTTVPPSNEPQGFSDESGRPAMDPYDILDLPKMNPTESNYPMGIEYDPELRAVDEDGNFLEEYQIEKFPSEISAQKRTPLTGYVDDLSPDAPWSEMRRNAEGDLIYTQWSEKDVLKGYNLTQEARTAQPYTGAITSSTKESFHSLLTMFKKYEKGENISNHDLVKAILDSSEGPWLLKTIRQGISDLLGIPYSPPPLKGDPFAPGTEMEFSAAKRSTISLDDPLLTEASTEPAEATSGGTPVEWLPIIDQAVKTIAGMTPVGLMQQVGESSLKHALGSVLKATGTLKRIMDGEVPANSDEGIAAITEIAGLYGGGGLVTAPLRPGIGIFGGTSRLTKHLPKEADVVLDKAVKLYKEGKSSQRVWEETGWYKDFRDEKWKFEIPDRGMQAKSVEIPEGELIHVGEKPSVDKFKPDSSVLLSEVIEHPLLFKIYPELKEVNVFVDKTMQPREAGAWERYKTIGISPEVAKALGENSLQARAVILHEIQHLIQNIEHFGKGGSPSQFKKKTPDEAYKAYMALPGEIESRNVADRFVIDTLRPYNNPRKYVPVPYQ